MIWNADRQRREIDLRLNRLQHVKREQEKLYLRRLSGWLLGRDEDRDKLLLERVLDDARQQGTPDSLLLVDVNPNWWQFAQLVHHSPKGADG